MRYPCILMAHAKRSKKSFEPAWLCASNKPMNLIHAIARLRGWPATSLHDPITPMVLARKDCLALEHPVGIAVFCHTGLLWITQFGSADDTLLHAGQGFEFIGQHAVTIQALHAASFELRSKPLQ